MGDATTSIKRKAQKIHTCSWCGQQIKPTVIYLIWTWFDGGTATTIKMHSECYEASQSQDDSEFDLHENTRGCTCHKDSPCCKDKNF